MISKLQPDVAPKCSDSRVAVDFWKSAVAALPKSNLATEGFWVLLLDGERRLIGAHRVSSKAFGDAQRFTAELFTSDYLRGVPEFLLVHNRPGIPPKAGTDDIGRVRAVILTGRAKKTELLDCLIVGEPDGGKFWTGVFSFHRLRGFSAPEPFTRPRKRTGTKVKEATP